MLIKSADDKSRRLALLQDLQQSSLLDAPSVLVGCSITGSIRGCSIEISCLPRA